MIGPLTVGQTLDAIGQCDQRQLAARTAAEALTREDALTPLASGPLLVSLRSLGSGAPPVTISMPRLPAAHCMETP